MENTIFLEKQKLKLQEEQNKLAMKKKLLLLQEKKKRMKQLADVGRIAYEANIDQLDREILYGAFLEIAQGHLEESRINQWKTLAKEFSKRQKNERTALALRFEIHPSEEVRNSLKKSGFKWNKFRKEFYGHGDKKELEELLKTSKVSIEVVDNV